MTFEQLMEQYQDLIARCVREANTLASVSPAPVALQTLRKALESELAHFGDRKGDAARMLADELVSRMMLPDGGGAVAEGNLGTGFSAADDPDLAEQEAMEIPKANDITFLYPPEDE